MEVDNKGMDEDEEEGEDEEEDELGDKLVYMVDTLVGRMGTVHILRLSLSRNSHHRCNSTLVFDMYWRMF